MSEWISVKDRLIIEVLTDYTGNCVDGDTVFEAVNQFVDLND